MRNRLLVLAAVAMLFVFIIPGTAQQAELGPVTQAVMERGELICGANANLTGFGFVNAAGEYEGFDIDMCKAMAAAILGDSTKVSYRPLTGADRQAAIQSGEIDVMNRNTTWTLSRDTTWGATFGPTTFYDGQGVMVPV
jgi:general L-amino acid transport system substrate-binding protein